MTKHTPGPWTIEYDGLQNGGQLFEIGPVELWYPRNCTKQEYETVKADSRLIAAAPDMLETLKQIAAMDCDCGIPIVCAVMLAKDAIAKAEGQGND
jgi:hypothetical protein